VQRRRRIELAVQRGRELPQAIDADELVAGQPGLEHGQRGEALLDGLECSACSTRHRSNQGSVTSSGSNRSR